jgi:RNA polymerase sigma-70 factor (ECF subfamily)
MAPDFSKPTHARFRAKLAKLVALAEAGQVARAKGLLAGLEGLDGYQPYHAARAMICARAGDEGAARAAYDRAIALAPTEADALYLREMRALLPD